MQFRIRLLEQLFLILLLGYTVETHTDIILLLHLEVKEAIWILQLVEVSLYVLVIVYVLLQLCLPLTTLLIVH